MKPTILKNPFTPQIFFGALALLVFTPLPFISHSQCVATTAHNPTNFENDASVGSLNFSNPSYAGTSDANQASANALVVLFTGNSHYLKLTGFNFNISPLASICGVTVEIENSASGIGLGWVRDNEVKLVKNGVVTGNNLGKLTTNWTGSESYKIYGGDNEMWGLDLEPEDINDPGFGVAISAKYLGILSALPGAHVNHARITVFYNPILPTHLISFSSTIKNKNVHLNWITADEEDDEVVTLQRKISKHTEWTDIARFKMQTGNSGKAYSHVDKPAVNNIYDYRLEISHVDGRKLYSSIRQVHLTDALSISLYPNPTTIEITIEKKDIRTDNVWLENMFGQKIKPNVTVLSDDRLRIEMCALSNGIYFIAIGEKRMKILKQ